MKHKIESKIHGRGRHMSNSFTVFLLKFFIDLFIFQISPNQCNTIFRDYTAWSFFWKMCQIFVSILGKQTDQSLTQNSVRIICLYHFSSVQFNYFVVQSLSHVRLCNAMDCNITGCPVHHQLPELARTHIHQVSDAIQS